MINRRSFFASVAALFAAKPILSCVPKSNSFASKYLNTALFVAERDFRVPFTVINVNGGKFIFDGVVPHDRIGTTDLWPMPAKFRINQRASECE